MTGPGGEEDPVAWLRAQVEARMATAKLAAREGGAWTQADPERYPASIESLGGTVVYDELAPDEYQAAHIAMNDPQDTIARCEAELAILDEHGGEHMCFENTRDGNSWAWYEGDCRMIRQIAGGYRHKPGYREEDWKP
jgi:hypothetical protein